jgi:hypothetical protein
MQLKMQLEVAPDALSREKLTMNPANAQKAHQELSW